eukprot:UN04265
MIRPQRIIQDLGVPDGKGLTSKRIKGSKHIRQLLEDIAFAREDEYQKKKTGKKKKKKHQDMYDEWKPPVPVFSKSEKAEKVEKELKMYEI